MTWYMSACDALLLTSHSEGSPNVVKEALACGLPVVSTDVGDVRRRLDGVEGCRVCPDDAPRALAVALLPLLEAPRRVDARAALAELDEAALARETISIYRRALDHHQSR